MQKGDKVEIISGNMRGERGIVYIVNGGEGYDNGKKYTLVAILIGKSVYHFRPDHIRVI